MKINKTNVDNLPIPKVIQEGKTVQKRYYDDNLKGFGIRIWPSPVWQARA